MAANGVSSTDPVPSQPEVPMSCAQPVKPDSRLQSAVSSPVSDEKVEWHVCPHCKSAIRAESKTTIEKATTSSNSSSPTTSDISQARSISFARLGHKIKEALSHNPESSSTTSTTTTTTTTITTTSGKQRLKQKKPQKKKPKKVVSKVVTFDRGYEELGADHWADDY